MAGSRPRSRLKARFIDLSAGKKLAGLRDEDADNVFR